VTTSSSK